MNINFMRYFVTVAETKSFTAASKKLNIAQPAISMALSKLERELGSELINRSKRKFELTYSGEVFLKHCINILNSTDNAITEIREINNLEQGSIKIGAPSLFSNARLPEIIDEFRALRPNLSLQIRSGDSQSLQKMILSNEFDVVMLNKKDITASMESTDVFTDELNVLMSKNNPLANSKLIPLKQLFHHPWCKPLDTVIIDKFLTQMQNNKDLKPNIVLETTIYEVIYSSLINQNLITINGSKLYQHHEDIISIPIEGGPYEFTLSAAWAKNRYVSKATQEFLNFLKTRVDYDDKLSASSTKVNS
ncbi:MAG: LysR family transcriptional regulator [Arenicella sp.]